MVEAMDDVGKRFQCNEVFVPEMLIAARAMKEAMARAGTPDDGMRPARGRCRWERSAEKVIEQRPDTKVVQDWKGSSGGQVI